MNLKRIAPHVVTYCTFCRAEGKEKVRAAWRMTWNDKDRACDDHKGSMPKPAPRDEHHTEADYQTWMKL
ncbi:MAG: hypothetical protein RSE62_03455 [Citrobacter sp.]